MLAHTRVLGDVLNIRGTLRKLGWNCLKTSSFTGGVIKELKRVLGDVLNIGGTLSRGRNCLKKNNIYWDVLEIGPPPLPLIVVAINCAGTSNVTSVYKRTFKWQGGIGSKNRQEAVEEKQISISGPTPTRIAVVLAGTGVGGEEVPVAIRKYFEDIAILLRNHPTVLPTTMLGLTRIDKNEAIVVRTTMASQQLGISPDAMLREIAYSHSRCFGKGERKFRFKVEGGYQQANCLGFQPNCLPLLRVPPILRTSPKTLFSLPHLKEQEMPPAQPQKEQEPQLKEQEMPPAQPQKEQELQYLVRSPLLFVVSLLCTHSTSVHPPPVYTLHQQSSLLEQSSMQQSVHEPLCFVEHTKLLMYRPSGSKRHFEITGGDLNCLHPHEYLNDKIINFYLT
eukprot:Em1250g1a